MILDPREDGRRVCKKKHNRRRRSEGRGNVKTRKLLESVNLVENNARGKSELIYWGGRQRDKKVCADEGEMEEGRRSLA